MLYFASTSLSVYFIILDWAHLPEQELKKKFHCSQAKKASLQNPLTIKKNTYQAVNECNSMLLARIMPKHIQKNCFYFIFLFDIPWNEKRFMWAQHGLCWCSVFSNSLWNLSFHLIRCYFSLSLHTLFTRW